MPKRKKKIQNHQRQTLMNVRNINKYTSQNSWKYMAVFLGRCVIFFLFFFLFIRFLSLLDRVPCIFILKCVIRLTFSANEMRLFFFFCCVTKFTLLQCYKMTFSSPMPCVASSFPLFCQPIASKTQCIHYMQLCIYIKDLLSLSLICVIFLSLFENCSCVFLWIRLVML